MTDGDYRDGVSADSASGGSRPTRRTSEGRIRVERDSRPLTRSSGRTPRERASARSSGERTSRTRDYRDDSTRRSNRTTSSRTSTRTSTRTSSRSSREDGTRHHLLTNTTYSPSTRSRSSRNGAGSNWNAAGPSAGALGFLDNLPFPKVYLLIALVAILLAIIIGVGVSTCSAPKPDDQANSAGQEQQQEPEKSESLADKLNSDISEDLRWRDTDFAVDPARTTWTTKDNGRKVVYLTIDDGPSQLTEQYLDLFDKYNCKVTFFVTGHDPSYYHLIHEAYKRGHTIGLHSMTHEYSQIYASEEAFMSDLDAVGQVVKDQIGYVPCFIRFPGGSSNTLADDYSKGLMKNLATDVQKLGYQYYDWNAAIGDGMDMTAEQLIETTKNEGLDTNIMLLAHDAGAKQTTLDALPTIIEYYQGLGYSFEAIDRDTFVCHHAVFTTTDETASATAANAQDGDETADGQGATTDDAENTDEAAEGANGGEEA